MGTFRKILGLSAADAGAKGLSFVAMVYVAREAGADRYGVLEFGALLLSYFLLLADAGLELWATRAASTGVAVKDLVARILPLRLTFAASSIVLLAALTPLLPPFPGLRLIVLLFALTLLPQAASLKWVFLGQHNTRRVAAGLLLSQLLFVSLVFAFFREPSHILLVPLFRLAADIGMALFFWTAYVRANGWPQLRVPDRESTHIVTTAFILGLSQAIGLLGYSFNTVLLGYLKSSTDVGWYSAAYKPVIVALALPLAYYASFFPVLARAYARDTVDFHLILGRSLRLTAVVALPLGVSVSFLAEPIILTLFGGGYREAIPILRVLCWSAVLVTLRGNFRQSLNAAGKFDRDLRSSLLALAANLALNLALIPRYGPLGAASATVTADLVWLFSAWFYAGRHLAVGRAPGWLWRPALAAVAMASCFAVLPVENWILTAAIAAGAYTLTLGACGEFRLLLAKSVRPLAAPVGARE
jgi:O-antigen/teichoic acid export membrane protein